ncbi:helix-turn-helix transcriptional regulator [Chryseobacterium sp. LAM-KRS1]|uniref:helix-turn-helix transcriptional regulator n=1 Tax=Chryseobacterium sp. LAM-KRS1 TaxID=2715754 RepID=UPI0015521F27|nr:hypothetical protein [Chryseobacterium sp. LAM-KRS1]
MKTKIILILLSTYTILYSQSTAHTASNNPKLQKEEIQSLLALFNRKYQNMELDASEFYAKKALAKSIKTKYSYGIAYSYLYNAQVAIDKAKFNTALQLLRKAEKESGEDIPLLTIEIHTARAKIYDMVMSSQACIKEQKKAFPFIEEITDKQKRGILQIIANNTISFSYLHEGQIDSLSYYLAKNDKLIPTLSEAEIPTRPLTDFYALKAVPFNKNKQYDSANFYINKSIRIAQNRQYKDISLAYFLKGNQAFNKKVYDSAVSYYLRSLKNMEELDYITIRTGAIFERLSIAYSKLGDVKNSNEYKLRFIEHQKQMHEYSDAHYTVIDEIAAERNEKEQEHINKDIFIIISIFLLLIIILIYFFYKRHVHHRKKINIQETIISKEEEKNFLLERKVNKAFDEVVQLAKENSPEFLTRFKEVYPEVISSLLSVNPKLQISELTFCAYLYLNFSSKNIAQYTFVTPRAVQLRKNRLRKKLNIPSEDDIYLWIKKIAENHI